MGQVFRARDTKLDRDVAIKILPEAFVHNTERLARFQREAKTLASLNHPNIAAIYGLEESAGMTALVMELVEGDDLSQRIARGAIPFDEALPIAKQIAEALEAAHEQGIVHRDLKPANIKIRSDSTVKVLDFGLAKALEPAAGSAPSLSQSPTITTPAMTQAGMILGTAAYMSPEQAKGRPVDQRTDVWAFGCVLYEMLTAKRAFEGDSVSDTLAAVLRSEPNWNALPAETTSSTRMVLRQCLERDPKRRLSDVSDAVLVIEDFGDPLASEPRVIPPQRNGAKHRAGWALALISTVLAVGLAVPYLRGPAPAPPVRFSITLPPNVVLTSNANQTVSVISPDSRRVVFVAGLSGGSLQLWVRRLDALDARPLPGTDFAMLPFWSPDSQSIGFFSNGKLKVISAEGGSVRTLCDAPAPRGASWSKAGIIVFAPGATGGLLQVHDTGGQPAPVTTIDKSGATTSHRYPSFLPDGRHFTYLVQSVTNEVWLVSLDGGPAKRLLTADSQAEYTPPGYLLFVRQGALYAQRFDARTGITSGEPTQVPVGGGIYPDVNGYASFSAADNGVLAYRTGRQALTTQLTWYDRAGRLIERAGQPGAYRNPKLSPDGERVALEVVDPQGHNQDIWILELPRGMLSRLTFDPHNDIYPVWSPDSSRIAFGSDRDAGKFAIYEKQANGSTGEQLVLQSGNETAAPYSWSPDGRFIIFRSLMSGFFSLGVLTVGDKAQARVRDPSPFNQTEGQVSSDGRWIAYHSNESGRYEVYVQTFPSRGGKWQISTDGGSHPAWRGDGRELYYYSRDGQLMAVPISSNARSLQAGPATPLFNIRMLNGPNVSGGFRMQYDVASDGNRFLINVPIDDAAPAITLVLNWTALGK